MASSEPLVLSGRFGPLAYSVGLCLVGREREGPQFTLRIRSDRAVFHTPADQTVNGCSNSVRISLRPDMKGSASAMVHASRFTRGESFRGCKVRFMLRPGQLLVLHRQGLLRSSFHPMSHLIGTLSITTRVNSQFPRPDLHRLDTQHYGLRQILSPHSGHLGSLMPRRM